jgi:polysaccharide biosynthesis protein PslG
MRFTIQKRSGRRRIRPLLHFLVLLALGGPVLAEPVTIKGLNTWVLAALPDNLQQVRDLGVSTVRVDLPWEQVEPMPNQFDWQKLDRIMEAAHGGDIQVLFTLRSISSWATAVKADPKDLYHHASRPKSMADWERFVQNLAQRYKGQGVHYEIENEVNANFWAGSLADYLDLLKASYRVIKAEDPEAKVLASAMACGVILNPKTPLERQRMDARHDEWLEAILATKAFDVINVHDYYFPEGPEVNGWSFQGYLQHILAFTEGFDVADRPVWITELGYVSRPVVTGGRTDNGSPEKQAAWLTAAVQQAQALGVERAFWLFLRDAPNTGYFGSMGLLGAGNVPRPAWQAYKAIGQR